jgi:hypothetical protein
LVRSSIIFTFLGSKCIESKTDLVRQGDTFYSNPPLPHLTTILVGHADFSLLYVTLVEMSVVGRGHSFLLILSSQQVCPFLVHSSPKNRPCKLKYDRKIDDRSFDNTVISQAGFIFLLCYMIFHF